MSDMNKKAFSLRDLAKIDIEASPRVRHEARKETVSEYAELLGVKGSKIPPPVLCEISPDKYLIADGLHRVSAMKSFPESSKQMFVCDVFKGDYAACLKVALQANLLHGLRRSNADKRAGVVSALKEFPNQSNGSIAEMCAVGDELVREVRKELEGKLQVPVTTERTGSDGRTRVVNPPKREVDEPEKVENKGKLEDSSLSKIETLAKSKVDKSERPKLRCETGCVIPTDLEELWNRRDEVKKLMAAISEVKCHVEAALKERDPLYREISNGYIAELTQARFGLTMALPYALCICNGKLRDKCMVCHGRGFVSQMRYRTFEEPLRKIREKAMAERESNAK